MVPEPAAPARTGYRFFVFTCRDPQSDFRQPLVEALRRQHETWYIWLRRRPIVVGPDGALPKEMSLPTFLSFIARFPSDGRINVYFNSTNAVFPGLSLLLRTIAPSGIWCLDMHDDLRYHYAGFKRLRETLAIALLRRLPHVTVHAAPTLVELFPESRRLGNASHIQPLSRDTAGESDVLILASFDERFDFGFLTRLADAARDMRFHLHGWTRRNDPGTLERIKQLANDHANVVYHGPYTTADLPGILSSYRVTVAPYLTNSILSRYIDPLRYYHCLNAGIEVVSTDIPAAHAMQPWVHIVRDPEECAETLRRIQSGALSRPPSFMPITWDERVTRLLEIIGHLDRATTLARRNRRLSAAPREAERTSPDAEPAVFP